MNKMRWVALPVLGLLLAWLTGCDPAYPPVIINQYSGPIEISVSFNGGSISETEIRLSPNIVFFQRKKGLQIFEITVKEPSGKLRTYHYADFENARSKQMTDFEVWILSEAGLRLADKKELQAIQRGRH